MAMKYVKVFYDWYEMSQALSDEEYGRLMRALLCYASEKEMPDLCGNERLLFPVFKNFVDCECRKYEEVSEKRREAGRRGGIKSAHSKQMLPNASNCNQEQEQEKEQEYEQEQEYEYEQEKEQENARGGAMDVSFSNIPSLEEIKSYCFERGNKVDAEAFFNYYTSIGWMVGKNPMRDWRAAVRSWEKHQPYTTSTSPSSKPAQSENKGSFDTDDFFEAALINSYGYLPTY